MFTILDGQDNEVAGKLKVERQETQWSFTPAKLWTRGKYRLKVHWELEDLAGNNLERLFEVNLNKPTEPAFARPRYLEFKIE